MKRLPIAMTICCILLARAAFAQEDGEKTTLETAPPVVVKTVPVAGDDKVDPDLKVIRVTFSKRMMDKTWSVTTGGMDIMPEIDGAPRYQKDGRTLALKVNLEPNKVYGMWFNLGRHQNCKDADGRSSVPYLLVFKTGGEK